MGFRFVLPGRFSFGVYNVRACVYMLPGFDIVERCNRTKSGDSLFLYARARFILFQCVSRWIYRDVKVFGR